MFSSADEVLKFIKDEDVKFVDIRFCDLPGVMQHFNVPAETVDEDFFTTGQAFDGSSIGAERSIGSALISIAVSGRLAIPIPARTMPTAVDM